MRQYLLPEGLAELFGVWQTVCGLCLDGSWSKGVDSDSETLDTGLGSGGVVRLS